MRTILLYSLIVLATITACDSKDETTPDYTAAFDSPSLSQEVRKGEDGLVDIVVNAVNFADKERMYNLEADVANSTAVEGVNYQFVSKIIRIPAGELSGKTQVKAIYKNLTPDGVDLTLKLTAVSQVQESLSTLSLHLSRHYQLNMAFLTQTWDAQNYKSSVAEGTDYEVTVTANGTNAVKISGLFNETTQIDATVDFENSQLVIPSGQLMFNSSTGNVYIQGITNGNFNGDPIVCNISYSGISIGRYGVINTAFQGWFPLTTTLSEQE